MDLTHWAYQAAAITTTLVGAAWTVVKLYFGVQKLRREARVADALADVSTIRAEIEGVKLRESQPDTWEVLDAPTETIPSLPESSVTEADEKGRGTQ